MKQETEGKQLFSLYDMVVVGVMAAIIFVLTYFVQIPIPTPAGQTMIKSANIFILLAGLLFGGLRGGLAAGIGSMIYDLLDPRFISDAPLTLIRFFLVAYVCGKIAYMNGQKGENKWLNLAGAFVGGFMSVFLYAIQSVCKLMIAGSDFSAAVVACVPKLVTSSINAIVAIVLAFVLVFPLRAALKKVGFYQKISIR